MLSCGAAADGCTSAIVGPKASRDGKPMLWKHRDTGNTDNFVSKVEATDSTLAYVALFNSGDTALEEAWIGFNEAGFAVMNTASYNLAPDTAAVKDREGIIMTEALKRCRTVSDFDSLLRSLPKPLGVQANFGVIDACGDGAYFETDDHSWKIFPLSESPSGVIVRTNFSCSGGEENRKGVARYETATAELEKTGWTALTPEFFTEHLSTFLPATGATAPDEGDFIPRRSSSASCVIEGAAPGQSPREGTVMWTALGFPPVAPVMAVTLEEIPRGMLPTPATGRSQLCDEATALRKRIISRDRNGRWHFNLKQYNIFTQKKKALSEKNYKSARLKR